MGTMPIRGRRTDSLRVYVTVAVAMLVCMAFGRQASAQIAPVRVRLPGYNQSLSLDSAATTPEAIPAGQEATRAATIAVLEALSIPVTTNDPVGLVGNAGFTRLRRLGNARLSTYVDCGVGLSGPQADTWRVTMAVMVWIEQTGAAESRLRLAFVAGAQDLDPGARRSAGCGSTGALELLLLERIRQQIARK